MRFIKRFFYFLLVSVIILTFSIIVYLFFQRPKYSGTIKISGIKAPVTTYFDPYGIPHIYADKEEDAFQVLGYIHAQERLFQIELIRRVSAGRLSEVFGNKTLEVDKFFRMLGMNQHAEKSATVFMNGPDSQCKRDAIAYLNGLNNYISKGKRKLEFDLLSIPSEQYTMKDLFLVVDYMSFNFQMGFRTDPVLSRIKNNLGDNYLADILKADPLKDTTSIDDSIPQPLISESDIMKVLDEVMPLKIWTGSNSYALSGTRTVSGKPLLENDTHIGVQQPAVWYEAYLEAGDFHFYGNFLAGFPFAPIGHTLQHGWGVTMLENDDLDFFKEVTDPKDSTLVLTNDHWEKITSRDEEIHVKDSASVIIKCRSTHHGPIAGDVMADVKEMTKSPVSICWTFLNFNSNLMEVTWQMAHAKDMMDFKDAVSKIAAPGLNIVYADTSNNIAWYTAAKFAIRPPHTNSSLLLDGTGPHDWQGYYNFENNPQQENPELGFVLSCNNDPQADTTTNFPGYYVPLDRYHRLRSLLFTKSKFTREDLEAITIDVKNPLAAEIGRTMIEHLSGVSIVKSQIHERASNILKYWNGDHSLSDVAPVIYYKFLFHFLQMSMEDELGEKDFPMFLKTHAEKQMLPSFFKNDSSVWWDNTKTSDIKESENNIAEAAFDTTISELVAQLGYDPDKWTWGKVHTIEFEHPIGKQKPLDKVFNVGPFPEMGGIETVNNQSFDLNSSGLYKVNLGPALRRVLDFADAENSYSINPSGQSGNFISKHYRDQAKLYVAGKYRKEMMNKEEVIKKCKDVLIFQPLN